MTVKEKLQEKAKALNVEFTDKTTTNQLKALVAAAEKAGEASETANEAPKEGEEGGEAPAEGAPSVSSPEPPPAPPVDASAKEVKDGDVLDVVNADGRLVVTYVTSHLKKTGSPFPTAKAAAEEFVKGRKGYKVVKHNPKRPVA